MATIEMTEMVTVRMSPELFRKLRSLAEADKRTVANMARVFIEEGCERRNNNKGEKQYGRKGS